MRKPFRDVIDMPDYQAGMEDGWETLREVSKLDKFYIKGLVKWYVGKNANGKTFRFAYKDTPKGRMWIKFKFD